MISANYKIWFDKQWFYLATVDPKGMSKEQVKIVSNLTNMMKKYVVILNKTKDVGGKSDGKERTP
jgi:hypothetical protein